MEIIPDIVSFQSNHVILAIPNDSNYIWLECTSQDDPFGYQAYFTDDRQALVIKPDGGEIVQTKIYIDKENTQNSKGSYSISEKGDFSGNVTIISEGTQYTQKARIEKYQPSDKEAFYKDYWDNINNLKINKITFNNDKEKIAFTENAELKAMGYGVVNGNSMMFAMNAFNQSITIPQRYRIRSNPLEIERGFLDTDEIEITLPENFTIDAKPNNYTIKDKFGEYKTELVVVSENKLRYKRSFLLNEGVYDKSEYENYRKFCEQIAKADNAKIVLIKKL
jgi:rRNA maturation protein Nop10